MLLVGRHAIVQYSGAPHPDLSPCPDHPCHEELDPSQMHAVADQGFADIVLPPFNIRQPA